MSQGMILLVSIGALLLLGMSSAPYAQSKGAAPDLYDDALTAMRAEDYRSAAQLFAKAQMAGLNTAALHYNHGVALYKLGRYAQARTEFMTAEKAGANVALIHYNLGLTSYRMGQSDEARQWFRRVVTESDNQRLTKMAEQMLVRLDEPVGTTATVPLWSLIADLKLGVDDNVTLENSELAQVTSMDDSYLDLYAAARYQLAGDRKRGYWGQLSASSLQYRQYDGYDYSQYDFGLFKDSVYGLLATRVGLRLSHSEIGTDSYLQKYTLHLQGDHPYSATQRLRISYDISRYNPLDNRYGYLAGLKGTLNLESFWRSDGRRYKLGYELENNSRDDYLSGNNFTSYSARRHELSASLTQTIAGDWQLTIGGDYRQSHYNDADVIAAVVGRRRKDDRWRGNLEAEYRLNRHLDLIAEYHYTNNDSSVSFRRYQRNQYLLGVQGNF